LTSSFCFLKEISEIARRKEESNDTKKSKMFQRKNEFRKAEKSFHGLLHLLLL